MSDGREANVNFGLDVVVIYIVIIDIVDYYIHDCFVDGYTQILRVTAGKLSHFRMLTFPNVNMLCTRVGHDIGISSVELTL